MSVELTCFAQIVRWQVNQLGRSCWPLHVYYRPGQTRTGGLCALSARTCTFTNSPPPRAGFAFSLTRRTCVNWRETEFILTRLDQKFCSSNAQWTCLKLGPEVPFNWSKFEFQAFILIRCLLSPDCLLITISVLLIFKFYWYFFFFFICKENRIWKKININEGGIFNIPFKGSLYWVRAWQPRGILHILTYSLELEPLSVILPIRSLFASCCSFPILTCYQSIQELGFLILLFFVFLS